jgi:hypothetical protein
MDLHRNGAGSGTFSILSNQPTGRNDISAIAGLTRCALVVLSFPLFILRQFCIIPSEVNKVDWPGALFTLQTQLGLPVHAGGKTALERKGYAHYLPAKQKRVFLYGPSGLALPAGQGEEAFPLHGREPGTPLADESGSVEGRSRKRQADGRPERPG